MTSFPEQLNGERKARRSKSGKIYYSLYLYLLLVKVGQIQHYDADDSLKSNCFTRSLVITYRIAFCQ
ncbi:MAG: hypothetical protein KME17_02915 [Cyanosarcina radialis HA8281-LM2]|nr:hypothetical protein [Cyanosarcina radialis HA8281-LM2]